MHVLNTPPAFVLSQNQTLRKNWFSRSPQAEENFRKGTVRTGVLVIWKMNFPSPTSAHRSWAKNFARRAAHNLILFSSSQRKPPCLRGRRKPGFETGPSARFLAGPYCQRACCEGTKKPIGCLHSDLRPDEHRDRHSVSRSPSFGATGGSYTPRPPPVNPISGSF